MHNNIIQRLEKISAKLFQESLKTFRFKDVIAHKKANPHTLVEMLSFYPNKGAGFSVFKKTWNPSLRIKITEANFKSNRYGYVKGVKSFAGKPLCERPQRIPDQHNRGLWDYEIPEEVGPVQLDNGLVYTAADYKAYKQMHLSYSRYKPATEAEEGAEEPVEAQEQVQEQAVAEEKQQQ